MLYLNAIFQNYSEFVELKNGLNKWEKPIIAFMKQYVKSGMYKGFAKYKTPRLGAEIKGFLINGAPMDYLYFFKYLQSRIIIDGCNSQNYHNFHLKTGEKTRVDMCIYTSSMLDDEYRGVCEDGTPFVRYQSRKDWKIYKMKPGKFLRHAADDFNMKHYIGEPLLNFFCENFANDWEALHNTNQYKLVVDDDFKSIYSSECCVGDFHSCMEDEGFHTFYENCVEAQAASLRNKDGEIVARCIIYTDVHKLSSGKSYRLAERQYATDQDPVLKKKLIDELIKADLIDGYKIVGASFSDRTKFVLNDGTPLNNTLYIECDYEPESEYVSYQDSFAFYNYDQRKAYNLDVCGANIELNITSGRPEMYWDEVNEEYCAEIMEVHIWDSRRCEYDLLCVNIEHRDDYYEYEGQYYDEGDEDENDDFIPYTEGNWCDYLNARIPFYRSVYCEAMDDDIPRDRYDEILEEWMKDNDKCLDSDGNVIDKSNAQKVVKIIFPNTERQYFDTEILDITANEVIDFLGIKIDKKDIANFILYLDKYGEQQLIHNAAACA